MLAILGIAIIFILSFLAYEEKEILDTINFCDFSSDQDGCYDHDRSILYDIFIVFINYGIRAGGGIGDIGNHPKG
jgi:hypothetical protein